MCNRRGVIVCIDCVLNAIKLIKFYYIRLNYSNLLLDRLVQTSLLNFRFVIRLNQHKSTLANSLINVSSPSSCPSFLPRANARYDLHRMMSSISNGKQFIYKIMKASFIKGKRLTYYEITKTFWQYLWAIKINEHNRCL